MTLHQTVGGHAAAVSPRPFAVPRDRNMKVEHFGESPFIMRGASSRKLVHGVCQSTLSYESSGKREIAQDQTVAELASDLKCLWSGGRNENVGWFQRRKSEEALCGRIQPKKVSKRGKIP